MPQIDLAELTQLARKKGKYGVAIINQGGETTPYVAGLMGEDGKFGNPCWNSHATPEGALAELREQMLQS